MKYIKLFAVILFFNTCLIPVSKATDFDYAKAAGHTGVYINTPNVRALRCIIKTSDLSDKNNKLGWYTAWPMIVDYKSKKFIQIGYITSPSHGVDKPTFYVAWSEDGTQVNVKYLPDKNSSGNALVPTVWHEYALSLNSDGTANIQIDGVKYLEANDERIKVGITEGKGEFFSEGSNINVDISTKFSKCAYKLVHDTKWRALEENKDFLIYYTSHGTTIETEEKDSFIIKGLVRGINKGKFLKNIKDISPKVKELVEKVNTKVKQ